MTSWDNITTLVVLNILYYMIKKERVQENNLITQGVQIPGFSMLFMTVLLVVSAFLAGYFYKSSKGTTQTAGTPTTGTQTAAQPTQPQISLDTIKGLFGKNLIKFGDANKKVLLVEVSDPSCPYCHVAAGQNKTIGTQMGSQFKTVAEGGTYLPPVTEMKKLVDAGQAGFVWIYTPGHGNGEMGTKAFYCAYDMGKFWQVHDLLMSSAGYDLLNTKVKNDKSLSGDVANFLAQAANPTQMKACLDSGKYDGRLGEETSLASSLGVQGTPGFFINTTNFAGAYSWTDMKPIADAALK